MFITPSSVLFFTMSWMLMVFWQCHDLSNASWGQEFSMCECAGSELMKALRIPSLTLRVQKTIWDMHKALVKDISTAGAGAVSKPVLNAFPRLLMPAFVSSYFFFRIILIGYIGAGFYASVQLSEFNIPTMDEELGNIVNIAREML